MKGVLVSFPVAIRLVFKDPLNFSLALIPSLLSLVIYFFGLYSVLKQNDYFTGLLMDFMPNVEVGTWIGYLVTGIFVLLFLVLMSWTYVILISILAAPFNSMLSLRIEEKLVGKKLAGKEQTFSEMFRSLGKTLKTELIKLVFVLAITSLAFLMNLVPIFAPIAVIFLALLMAAQFLDYSWSRNEYGVGDCLGDLSKNILPYGVGGGGFLLLVTLPVVNAFLPALATSYFTVLWLYRQGKLT